MAESLSRERESVARPLDREQRAAQRPDAEPARDHLAEHFAADDEGLRATQDDLLGAAGAVAARDLHAVEFRSDRGACVGVQGSAQRFDSGLEGPLGMRRCWIVNYDFSAWTEEDRRNGTGWNFGTESGAWVDVVNDQELMALSAFVLDDGVVYHTYSAYDRGTDALNSAWALLDRAPKGREDGADRDWPRRHDEY